MATKVALLTFLREILFMSEFQVDVRQVLSSQSEFHQSVGLKIVAMPRLPIKQSFYRVEEGTILTQSHSQLFEVPNQ